jgi:hypothetical protein
MIKKYHQFITENKFTNTDLEELTNLFILFEDYDYIVEIKEKKYLDSEDPNTDTDDIIQPNDIIYFGYSISIGVSYKNKTTANLTKNFKSIMNMINSYGFNIIISDGRELLSKDHLFFENGNIIEFISNTNKHYNEYEYDPDKHSDELYEEYSEIEIDIISKVGKKFNIVDIAKFYNWEYDEIINNQIYVLISRDDILDVLVNIYPDINKITKVKIDKITKEAFNYKRIIDNNYLIKIDLELYKQDSLYTYKNEHIKNLLLNYMYYSTEFEDIIRENI